MRENSIKVLVLATLAVVTFGSIPDAFGQSPGPRRTLEDLAWERGVKAAHEASLLEQPGVFGVGIAERGGEPVILVLADTRRARSLPSSLGGVTVVVENAEPATFIDGGAGCVNFPDGCHSEEYPLPVPMGVTTSSDAHYNAGTLGFKACDAATSTLGYVSANHVAAGIPWDNDHLFCFNGAPGLTEMHPGLFEVDPDCASDPACIPPDPADFTNEVGILNKIVEVVGGPAHNKVDAAFVASDDQLTSPSILDIGVPSSSPGTPALNDCVRKSGRTTGLTHGRIDILDLTWTNTFDTCFPVDPIFEEVIAVVPDNSCGLCGGQACGEFAIGGDSGSALVNDDDEIVGLVFARESGVNGMVFSALIDNVLGELDLTLDLSQCEPNLPPVAVDDWFLTLWETPVNIPHATLLANDTDPESDPLRVCGFGHPQHGTLTPSTKTSFTYTPPPGCLVGLDNFTYRVCDDHGNQDTGTAWITISGIICPSGNNK